jgi:serine/threonine protein phosphatase PrpC
MKIASQLKISVGQHSDKGRKEQNQDFHGICIPKEPQLSSKGIAMALADGISSSDVSHIASETAVTGFLEDYYCTSEAWSVKTSAERVLSATNSWLYSQTQQGQGRYDHDRGFVCTLSVMVIKSTTAHIFHVGDTRIYQLRDQALEQLTCDHRVSLSPGQTYLSRALGVNNQLEIDYQSFQVEKGDIFLLATDGVYEYVDARFISAAVHGNGEDLDKAAKIIVGEAYRRGSADNLTIQLARIEELPSPEINENYRQLYELPVPPILEARMAIDGYRIVREVHGSSRSHIYLAVDSETGELVIIKTPSIDLQSDPSYLERLLLEEWIARRINNAHVVKPCFQARKRTCLYIVMEFIDGQTLAQWIIDHPRPELETVRSIVEQIAKGLQAFHRLEMLHQDLRPENIMIDDTGTVKIIDFGSASIAGILETSAAFDKNDILGTTQYSAPEYFLGERGSPRSDIFSLGVISYQMLSGRLPYGVQVARCRTREAQKKLIYHSVLDDKREIPAWIDEVLRKAVHPNPSKRYGELSEFIFDLRHPNTQFLKKSRQPLMERNPLVFWRSISFILAAIVVLLAGALAFHH